MNTPLDSTKPFPKKLSSYVHQLMRQYKFYILGLAIIAIVSSLFHIGVDYELQQMIDSVAENPNVPMVALLVYFIFHKTMHHVFHFLQKLLSVFYKPKILKDVTETTYAQVMRHSLYWFDSHLSGEISNKVHDFQDSLLSLLTSFFYVASHVSVIGLSLVFLASVSGSATLVLGVFIMIYGPMMGFFLKKQMHLEKECASMRQETFGMINDSVSNVFGIKTMGRLSWEFAKTIEPYLQKWQRHETASRRYHAYYVDIADTVMILIMGAVQMTVIALLYRRGQITPGQFTFVTLMTLQVHRELGELVEKIVVSCNPKIAALKSVYAFLQLEPGDQDSENSVPLKNILGKIEYRDVSFAYDDEKPILKNIHVTILPGQKVGIVGPSGAGKSTFIKCLLKYLPIQEGTIFLDDIDIGPIGQDRVCSEIALIPQEAPLFHRSILDNLRLVKPDASMEEIEAACKKAHIHDDIVAMKNQYHTLLGERGSKISGGQRQRLAIARALLKKAPILILDEATSALDTPTERLIQDALTVMIQESQSTTLMISHRLSTLKGMDRILVFDRGEIVQDGSHDVLMQNTHGLYKSLWGGQMLYEPMISSK